MEEITRTEEHKRDWNGNIITENNLSREHKKSSGEKRLWIVSAMFICVFSFMILMLGISSSRNISLAGELNDMTAMYQNQKTTTQNYGGSSNITNYQESDDLIFIGEENGDYMENGDDNLIIIDGEDNNDCENNNCENPEIYFFIRTFAFWF